MEFNEKLQELRRERNMTQEELSQALFVSRTAISKWESGRGYPSIDSLKEISRYFNVTIDALICSEEVIVAAEHERKSLMHSYTALICSALDLFPLMLILIPVFGNGADVPTTVSLTGASGIQGWIRATFCTLIAAQALNGILGLFLAHTQRPRMARLQQSLSMCLSIICVSTFIICRQPYASIICFSLLVLKAFLTLKTVSA